MAVGKEILTKIRSVTLLCLYHPGSNNALNDA